MVRAKTTSTGNYTAPLRGVKQGCPLSPLLFSLFINDVDDEFGTGFMGAVTGTEGLRVTHMLYADDLTLTANDPVQFKMRSTSFFHVSVPNSYGTSSSTYLIIFLKVISKVLFFNITQFANFLVQLSIFLIDLFVGTYKLSSHARLEAFVIQTKLKTHSSVGWFFHLGGLSWSEGATIFSRCAESYTLQ